MMMELRKEWESKMKVIKEMTLREFEFWSGAVPVRNLLSDAELEVIEQILEEIAEDEGGMTETEINDFFWFDNDLIAEWLGYKDYDDLWNMKNHMPF